MNDHDENEEILPTILFATEIFAQLECPAQNRIISLLESLLSEQ